MINISNRNLLVLIVFLAVSIIVVSGFLLMVAGTAEGYNPNLYKNAYVFLAIFETILLTLVICLWDITKDNNVYLDSLLLCIISIPLYIVLFSLGNITIVNILIPLAVMVLWNAAVLSLRKYLTVLRIDIFLRQLIIFVAIFSILILTLIFAYFYKEYNSLVITTVFDNDIPILFFINPILIISGISYTQIGGSNYLGYTPVLCYLIFYITILFVLSLLTKRKTRPLKYMEEHRK